MNDDVPFSDLVFILDATGSMGSYLKSGTSMGAFLSFHPYRSHKIESDSFVTWL